MEDNLHSSTTETSTSLLQLAAQLRELGRLIEPQARYGDQAILGKFIVQQKLGSGGQAIALLAYDPDLERQVVLKLYYSTTTMQQRIGVLSEGRALAKIDHPNVAKCYGVETLDGHPTLILEYVPGPNLKDLKNVEASKAVQICASIARGVKAIHGANLLHRDLKPSNVILTNTNVPKIIDFGLVQPIGELKSSNSSGTPAFMSPERAQLDFKSIDQRSDIFGVGAILYFLLTGRPPYSGETSKETRTRAKVANIQSPMRLNPKLTKEINHLCMKSLEKHPSERFQCAGEMADALESLTDLGSKFNNRRFILKPFALLSGFLRHSRKKVEGLG